MAGRSSALPEPNATGSFSKTPFVNLLVYAEDRKLSGTVELTAPDETATVVFVEGHPAKARTSQPVAYLGRVLMELGLFNQAQLETSLQAATRDKRLHGQVLMALGLITQEQLDRGLSAQLARKLRYVARLPAETTFAYYDGIDVLRAYGGAARVTLDPYPLVWAALRESPPWEHVRAALARLGQAPMKLVPSADLGRFEFDRGERATVELLVRPHSVQDVVAAGIVDPRLAQQLLYCMLIAKQVDLASGRDEGETLEHDGDAPVTTPVRLPADPVEQRKFVEEEFAKAESKPPEPLRKGPIPAAVYTNPTKPSMKAVRPRPAPSPVEKAEAPAPATAPPPLAPAPPPPPPAPPQPEPAVAAELGEADLVEVVSSPPPAPATAPAHPASARPPELVVNRSEQYQLGEPAPIVDPIAQGAEHYQTAQSCLKSGEIDKAEGYIRKAIVCEPEKADYHVLRAQILGTRAETKGSVATELAIEVYDKALRLDPSHAVAYFQRAMLKMRLGREDEALEDLRKVLELKPDHVDAQREVRLIELRRHKEKEKEGEKGGLLGKLFRK